MNRCFLNATLTKNRQILMEFYVRVAPPTVHTQARKLYFGIKGAVAKIFKTYEKIFDIIFTIEIFHTFLARF